MDLFNSFSSKDNLKKAYQYIKDELTHSTLAVTPINHASITAIDSIGDHFFLTLEKYIKDGKYLPEKGFFVYIPKDNLGLRPVCIPAMIDHIIYQATMNQKILGNKIDGKLSDKVCFANRVNEKEDDDSYLSPYFNGYDNFLKKQKESFEKGYIWKLELDIQQFYENIDIEKLIDILKKDFNIKDNKILDILKLQLNTWSEYENLPMGIPQGPNASAVLSNAYLNPLDKFAEEQLVGKEIRYFRYADDISLMGTSKEAVLKSTEKIVRFLRSFHLALNEKTHLIELENSTSIEEMRILSDYEDTPAEIPADEFDKVKNNIPKIIDKISNNENIEKLEMRQIRYYLKVGTKYNIDFLTKLIKIIPLRPSLTIAIIKYISEGRKMLEFLNDSMSITIIDKTLWEVYKNNELSEWSKFWILKLFASNKEIFVEDLEIEFNNILNSKEPSIFKIVALYYKTIKREETNANLLKIAIDKSKTGLEKSWYYYFLLNCINKLRKSSITNYIDDALNYPSAELNLIGFYLYKNSPEISIENIEGPFSIYLYNKLYSPPKKDDKKLKEIDGDYYLISKNALLPLNTSTSILGLERQRRLKHTIQLNLPEEIDWEKVTFKLKEGLKELEIFYNDKHLKTVDYIELGFYVGKKQQKTDRSWGFICALSVLLATDISQATADNMRSMIAVNTRTTLKTANVHRIKKTLSNRLRAIFKTDKNPFANNKDYYQPNFKILPPPDLRNPEIWQQGGKLNENKPPEETTNYLDV